MLSLLLFACGEEPTALRLKLVVDPQLNGESQLLSVVQNIELVLDAQDGFVGIPAEGSELTAKDVDHDGKQELVLNKPVAGERSFPLYRLLPGSNTGRSFYITARGTVGNLVAAIGGSALAQFVDTTSPELSVPLNLRPGYRAPRVVMSLPHDGQQAPASLSNIYLEFSKWIDQRTIEKNLRVVWYGGRGDPQPVEGSWTLVNIAVNELGFPEERTAATFIRKAGCRLTGGEYRIEAGVGVTDTSSNALDQDAQRPGPDGFRSTFFIDGTPSPDGVCEKDTVASVGCTDNASCNPDATTVAYVCYQHDGTSDCVPNGGSCPACPPGSVCAPLDPSKASAPSTPVQVGSSPQMICVPDCRPSPGICGPGRRCDFGSGLCKECLFVSGPSSDPSGGSPSGPVTICNLPCGSTTGGCPLKSYCEGGQRCTPCPADAPTCI